MMFPPERTSLIELGNVIAKLVGAASARDDWGVDRLACGLNALKFQQRRPAEWTAAASPARKTSRLQGLARLCAARHS
jgi:hypothetical protein